MSLFDLPIEKHVDVGNEWYTPARYVEAAHKVMGKIDLDPASSPLANQIVRANRYYTEQEDGLRQSWEARSVWLNPPYGKHPSGRSNLSVWSLHLIEQYRQGIIQEAILLAVMLSDSRWFRPLWDYPICFCDHQISFQCLDRPLRHHQFGTIFVYFGKNERKFIDVFTEFGPVIPGNVVIRRKQLASPLGLWTA